MGKPSLVLILHLVNFRWMHHGDESPWFKGNPVYREAPGETPGSDTWKEALDKLRSVLNGQTSGPAKRRRNSPKKDRNDD